MSKAICAATAYRRCNDRDIGSSAGILRGLHIAVPKYRTKGWKMKRTEKEYFIMVNPSENASGPEQ